MLGRFRWLASAITRTITISLALVMLALPAAAWEDATLDQLWRTQDMVGLQQADTESDFAAAYRSFRIALLALSQDDKKLAKNALTAIIERYANQYQTTDEAALYYAALGASIALRPWQLLSISRQSEQALAFAKDADKTHAPTLMVEAIGLVNAPALFGGDKRKAVALFQQALTLYAQQSAWGEEDAWLWKIKALQDLGENEEARAAKALALQRYPDFIELQNLLLQ